MCGSFGQVAACTPAQQRRPGGRACCTHGLPLPRQEQRLGGVSPPLGYRQRPAVWLHRPSARSTSLVSLRPPLPATPSLLPRVWPPESCIEMPTRRPLLWGGGARPLRTLQNRRACGPKPDVDWCHLLDLRRKGGWEAGEPGGTTPMSPLTVIGPASLCTCWGHGDTVEVRTRAQGRKVSEAGTFTRCWEAGNRRPDGPADRSGDPPVASGAHAGPAGAPRHHPCRPGCHGHGLVCRPWCMSGMLACSVPRGRWSWALSYVTEAAHTGTAPFYEPLSHILSPPDHSELPASRELLPLGRR